MERVWQDGWFYGECQLYSMLLDTVAAASTDDDNDEHIDAMLLFGI